VRAIVLAVLTGIFVATAASAVVPDASSSARLAVEPPLPAGHARCIVVLQRGAKDVGTEAVRLGGKIEADLGDRLVVTMPLEAVETLRGNAGVKFIERALVGDEPVRGDRPELRMTSLVTSSLIGVPIQTNSGQTWTTGDFTYDGSGNIVTIGTAATSGTQGYRTYGYDSVARLTKAQISGVTPAGTYEYSYDPYGNRTGSALNQQWSTVPVSSTTNRLTAAAYDSSGNQLARGVTSATYDGFSMPTSYHFDELNAETFIYTANDERIGVLRGTDWTWSLRDSDGKVLRQYRSSSTNPTASWLWVEDFVYRNGLLLGAERVAEEGGRRHYHLDHLGSPRLVTGLNGSVISEHDFLPFGEERTTIAQHMARGFDREEPLRFTGHERDFDNSQPNDSSSYLDYMHARYYGAEAGRFLSVDPVLGNLLLPQSWNRYAYVLNNPIRYTDPTGLTCQPGEPVGPDGGCTSTVADSGDDWSGTSQGLSLHDFFMLTSGAANAYSSDNLLGIGRQKLNDDWYQRGQLIGDAGAMIEGFFEVQAGFAGEAGGFVLDATGIGALVGVPVQVVSAGLVAHGGVKTGVGAWHLMSGIKQRKEGTLGRFKGTDAKDRENKQVLDALRKAGLESTRSLRRRIHDALQGQPRMSFQELVEFIKDNFGR
jgi:RHS repeat-associated protein